MTHPGTQPIEFFETPEPGTAGNLFQDAVMVKRPLIDTSLHPCPHKGDYL